MKVLVATDKPFAKVAVDGIRKEIEAPGYELVLLEKYGEKAKLLEAVKMPMLSLFVATSLMRKYSMQQKN